MKTEGENSHMVIKEKNKNEEMTCEMSTCIEKKEKAVESMFKISK